MIPLSMADTNTEVTIRKIGGNQELKRHLEELGFTIGGTVTLVSVLGENVIVKVKDSRIAIGADMARKIMV